MSREPSSDLFSSSTSVDAATLRRLADSWPRRASVKTDFDRLAVPDDYEPGLPDYPARLLPFADHPHFLSASPEQMQLVLTLAWIVYNDRVIAAEEWVVNPTLSMIVRGVLPAQGSVEMKMAAQQAHIDEAWHTYMHMLAMRRTREARGLQREPDYPPGVIYRKLVAAQAAASEGWERDLLMLAWTTVGETTINAYLDLLGRDTTVQPYHALVARLHARDESAHGAVMVNLSRNLFQRMSPEQQRTFATALPKAMDAFASHDFAAWQKILDFAGIKGSREIIGDCVARAERQPLIRDYSAIQRLVGELGIEDLIDYDFAKQH